MKGDNIVAIIRSPAVTVLVAALGLLVIMRQVPLMITSIKAAKKAE